MNEEVLGYCTHPKCGDIVYSGEVSPGGLRVCDMGGNLVHMEIGCPYYTELSKCEMNTILEGVYNEEVCRYVRQVSQ